MHCSSKRLAGLGNRLGGNKERVEGGEGWKQKGGMEGVKRDATSFLHLIYEVREKRSTATDGSYMNCLLYQHVT